MKAEGNGHDKEMSEGMMGTQEITSRNDKTG
jgi:hypothetical protein